MLIRNRVLLGLIFLLNSGFNQMLLYAQNSSEPQQHIESKQYELLQKAVERYERIKENELPLIGVPRGTTLRLNDRSPLIPSIKERLDLLGDIRRPGSSDIFTPKLEDAVKNFQLRHGLEDDGIIGPAFMKALNVPIENRIQQMMVNMSRIMEDSIDLSDKKIVANIPEYKLYVYEDNQELMSMDIVVGKITNPTQTFSDTVEQVVFSPYWNVPESIVRNEILPEISKDPGYLEKNNMEITGKLNGLPVIRQRPGPENSLGKVKFLFPNQYYIYLHDTPSKSLFDRKTRTFSHGCIRVSEPFELAKYLLKNQSEWTDEKINQAMNAGKEKWVTLREPVPVSIIYYTSWIDEEGQVNFRDDIYGHDQEQMGL